METIILGTGSSQDRKRSFPWWIPLTLGALIGLIGIAMLFWPFFAASWMLALLFGFALIFSGFAMAMSQSRSGVSTVVGVLLVIGGLLAILFRESTATSLVTFLGVILVVLGSIGLISVLAIRANAASAVLPPVLMIAAGIGAFVLPEIALVIISILAGFGALLISIAVVSGALSLRRASAKWSMQGQ